MRILYFLLQKEFKQIFRNKAILPLIFIAPILQLLILPLAADYEVKNINIAVVDHDRSTYAQDLVTKIQSSGYFRLVDYSGNYNDSFEQLEQGKADLILEIPQGFERNLVREGGEELFIAINAINGVKANLGGGYLNQIIADYNQEIRTKWLPESRANQQPVIEIATTNRFNPYMNYHYFIVPGILVLLVTIIGSYMCALNIVKEKEIGTIEQINVTPIQKYQFILGKLIPFWVIGMFVFTIGLLVVGWLIYGIAPVGNILLLYAYLSIYLVAVLGLGLLISTYSENQQQAMSITFFFMMIFMLMSGLFTSLDGMPRWAYYIAMSSPVTYFVEVTRMIVLKGSTYTNIQTHFIIMLAFAVVINVWAVVSYRKVS